eukprot:1159678-Pelagomonas_calceolata.AAC.2
MGVRHPPSFLSCNRPGGIFGLRCSTLSMAPCQRAKERSWKDSCAEVQQPCGMQAQQLIKC